MNKFIILIFLAYPVFSEKININFSKIISHKPYYSPGEKTYWNNLHIYASDTQLNLFSENGRRTGVFLQIIDSWDGAIAEGKNLYFDPESYFYFSCNNETGIRLGISGLVPGKNYSVEFFSENNFLPVVNEGTITKMTRIASDFSPKSDSHFFSLKCSKEQKQFRVSRIILKGDFPFYHEQKQTPDSEKLPVITAKSWAIVDAATGMPVPGFSYRPDAVRQMASFAKLMNVFLLLNLGIDLGKEMVTVSDRPAKVEGNLLGISKGESYTAESLVYGMLLPSGCDVAEALAEHFAQRMEPGEDECHYHYVHNNETDGTSADFVNKMNHCAKQLNMKNTRFTDSFGISSTNTTTAADIALLAAVLWKNKQFRRIANTREYVLQFPGTKKPPRYLENSNKLLTWSEYSGIKTGTTPAAGFSLMTTITHRGKEYIIIVMGASSDNNRYADIRNIARWFKSSYK